jgi:hypothetical protein
MARGFLAPTSRLLVSAALLASSWPALAQEEDAAPPPAGDAAPTETPTAQPDGLPNELPDAVVRMRNGQRVSGKLVEQTDERVVLLVGSIPMELAVTQIDGVEVLPSIAEQYESMRRTIAEKDLPQRLMLVNWLVMKEKYEWALREVESVLDQDPASPSAQDARKLIVEQLALQAKAGRPKPPARGPIERPPKFRFPLLTPDQINLIKVYEVDLRDPPRMLVPRDAVDALLDKYAGNPLLPNTREGKDALYRRPAAEVLDLMFRLHARDLYGMIEVQDQPRAFELFRDQVQQTWLINSCATDRCHGGAEAGRLRLHNKKPNSDATIFTNFLILDRFRTSADKALIDFDEPARSPLLQMGLPREDSNSPHPPVPTPVGRGDAWKPIFESASDKRFEQALGWIGSLYQPRPDYPIEYTPPAGAAGQAADAGATPPVPR